MVEAAREYAAPQAVNLVVGLGDGDALDFAKLVNVLLTNGGSIRDYRGYGNVPKPLLPMIAVPTTAASGSEAQGNAAIADPDSRSKMICGDPKIFYRTAILDPKLTLGQTAAATAANGYDRDFERRRDAVLHPAHAHLGMLFARSMALARLEFRASRARPGRSGSALRHAAGRALRRPGGRIRGARTGPRLRAAAGRRITNCRPAPRWRWCWLPRSNGSSKATDLLPRLRELAAHRGAPAFAARYHQCPEQALPRLADEAAAQWSGRFSSRHFDAAAALEIYRAAL